MCIRDSIKKRDQLLEVRNIVGGVIVQETDVSILSKSELKTVTDLEPSEEEINTMLFGWKVLKHIKSNGILVVKESTLSFAQLGKILQRQSSKARPLLYFFITAAPCPGLILKLSMLSTFPITVLTTSDVAFIMLVCANLPHIRNLFYEFFYTLYRTFFWTIIFN